MRTLTKRTFLIAAFIGFQFSLPAHANIVSLSNTPDPFTPGTTDVSVDLDTPPAFTDLVIEILDPNNLMGDGVNSIQRRLFGKRIDYDLTGVNAVTFDGYEDLGLTLFAEGTYQAKAYEGMTATYNMKIQGTGIELSGPADMAVDSNGNIYLVNNQNGCVEKINPQGTLLVKFGCNYMDTPIIYPRGIAVDSSGNIYISADDGTGVYRIEKWSSSGTPINQSYITGANVANARGLGIDRVVIPERLYLAGCSAADVFCRFSVDTGAFIDQWDSNNTTAYDIDVIQGGGNIYTVSRDDLHLRTNAWGAGCNVDTDGFGSGPAIGVTVDAGGNAIISNQYGDYIRKYNSSCVLQYSYGSEGSGDDQFRDPYGVVIYTTDNLVYVNDSGNNRIKVVNDTGAAFTFNKHIEGDNYNIPRPIGMDVDPAKNIYIALRDMAKVKTFTYNGQYTEGTGEALGKLGTLGGFGSGCGKYEGLFDVAVWDDPADADGIADKIYVSFDAGAAEDLQCYNVDTGCWNNGNCCGKEGELPASPGNGCGAGWGNNGIAPGGITTYCFGVGSGDDGRVYCPSNTADRIYYYEHDGTYVGYYDPNLGGTPYDVEIAPFANMMVTSGTSGTLGKVRPNGTLLYSLSAQNNLGNSVDVWGISVDKFGNVYMAMTPNTAGDPSHGVIKYSNYGYPGDSSAAPNHVREWMAQIPTDGTAGTGDGQFKNPKGLAVDPDSQWIWIADTDNNRAQKFILNYNTMTDPITIQCTGNPRVNLVTLSGTPVTVIGGNTYSRAGEVTIEVAFCKDMDNTATPTVTFTTVNSVEFTVTQTYYSGNIWRGTVTVPDYTHTLCGNGTPPSTCDGQAQISILDAKDTLGNYIVPNPTNPVTDPGKNYLLFVIDTTAPDPPTITSPLDDTTTTLTIQPVTGISEANAAVRVTVTTFACIVREDSSSLNDTYDAGVDTLITGACAGGEMLTRFGSLEKYYDANSDGNYDNGEPVIQDTGATSGYYDGTDRVLVGTAPTPGETLTAFASNEKVKIDDYQDTTADSVGDFYGNDINLTLGANYIAARAIDVAGNAGLYSASRVKRTRSLTDPGVATISPNTDIQIDSSGQWTITFTAIDPFPPGGAPCAAAAPYDCYVVIDVPSGWSEPNETSGLAGELSVTEGVGTTLIAGADKVITNAGSQTIYVNINSMNSGSYFDLVYGATDPPGAQVTTSAALGLNEFRMRSANKGPLQTLTSPAVNVRGLPIKVSHTGNMPATLYDEQQNVKIMTVTFRNISPVKTVEIKGLRLTFVTYGASPTPDQIITRAVVKDLAITYVDETNILGNSVGNVLALNIPGGNEIVIGPGAARSVFVYFDFASTISSLGLGNPGLEILLDADTKIYTGASTGLTETMLTDSGANWAVNTLLGYMLIPDTAAATHTYVVKKNTATAATVRENTMVTDGATTGDPYAIGNADDTLIVKEQSSQVSLRAGPDTGDTFYPDAGDTDPQMSSGKAGKFLPPPIAQNVTVSVYGQGWNPVAQKLSKGQTGSKPFILKVKMYDQLLAADCTPTCTVVKVDSAALFSVGETIYIGDDSGVEQRTIAAVNTGVTPNEITISSPTSRAFLVANNSYVTRSGASVKLYNEIFTIWDCHTNAACNVVNDDWIDPGGPNTVISRSALRKSGTTNYFINDSSIEASGDTITLDTSLNPIILTNAEESMNIDVLIDILCSPGFPDCSLGTNESKLKLSVQKASQIRASTFQSLLADCIATATVYVSDASKYAVGGMVVVGDDNGSEWKTVLSRDTVADTVTFTSATTGSYTTAAGAYLSHTKTNGSFPMVSYIATIQDHAEITVQDVEVVEDALCPSELYYGEQFTVRVTVQNTSGDRPLAYVDPSAADLKLVRFSDSVDYTSQFTITPLTSTFSLLAGATGTATYTVFQDKGTTIAECPDYFVTNTAANKPSARDGNDYQDSDPLYVNYDSDGDPTPPNEPSIKPTKAYVKVYPVDASTPAAGAANVLVLNFTITDSPDHPLGEIIRSLKIASYNTTDSDVANVVLWEDTDDDGYFEPGTDDASWATTTFSGASATFVFTGPYPQVPATATQRFFVSYDIATAVTDGDTLDAALAANGITLGDNDGVDPVIADFTIPPSEMNSLGVSTINVVATKLKLLPASSQSCPEAEKVINIYAYDDYDNLDTGSSQYVELNVDLSGQFTNTTLASPCYNTPLCTSPPDNNVTGNLVAGVATVNVTDSVIELVTVTPTSGLTNSTATVNFAGTVCMNARSVTPTTPPAAVTDVLIMDIKITNGLGSAITVNALTVNNVGAATDTEIATATLYYDSNDNLAFDAADTVLGTPGAFTSGSRTFNFSQSVPAATAEYFFVTYNLASVINDGDTLDGETPINGLTYNDGADKTLDDIVTNSPGVSTVNIVANTIRLVPDHSTEALLADCGAGCTVVTVADASIYEVGGGVTLVDDLNEEIMTVTAVDTSGPETVTFSTAPQTATFTVANNAFLRNFAGSSRELTARAEDTYGNLATQLPEGSQQVQESCDLNSYVSATTLVGGLTGGQVTTGDLTTGTAGTTFTDNVCLTETVTVTSASALTNNLSATINFPGDPTLDVTPPSTGEIGFQSLCTNDPTPVINVVSSTDDCAGIKWVRFACEDTLAAFLNAAWVTIQPPQLNLDVCCNCPGDPRDVGCGFNITTGETCLDWDGAACPGGWYPNAASGCTSTEGAKLVYVQFKDANNNVSAVPGADSDTTILDNTSPQMSAFYFSAGGGSPDPYFFGSYDYGECTTAREPDIDGSDATKPLETNGILSDECPLWFSNTVEATQTVSIMLTYTETGATTTFQGSPAFGDPIQSAYGATGTDVTVAIDYGVDSTDGTAATTTITFELFDGCGNGATETFEFWRDVESPGATSASGYASDSKAIPITTATWYGYSNPYFEWSAGTDNPAGTPYLYNAGLGNYQYDFSTESDPNAAIPYNTTATGFSATGPLVSGYYYYLRMRTTDNVNNSSATGQAFVYYYDTDAPDNPAAPVNGWDTSAKATVLTSGQSYTYLNPYFEWSAPSDNPAAPLLSSGVDGYYAGFATDVNYDPTAYQTATSFTGTPTTCYENWYLKLKTADKTTPQNVNSTSVVAFTYVRKGTISITDNQGGDDTWRNATVTYDVDFGISCGTLDRIQYTLWSAAGMSTGTGTEIVTWTTFQGPAMGTDTYNTDWPLLDADWGSATDGINWVSVRAYDTLGNYETATDVFYILKDAQAPDNPAVTGYDSAAQATTLTDDTWYKYPNPYFSWAGASDNPQPPALSSGFKQFNLYFGTENCGAPTYSTDGFATEIVMTLASNTVYYLCMSCEDNVGNATTTTRAFTYKYDPDPPTISFASGAASFASESSSYMWVSSKNGKLYFDPSLPATATFSVYGTAADPYAGIATVTFSAAFADAPSAQTWTPATTPVSFDSDWNSDTYDVAAGDTDATITITAYDFAGNTTATDVAVVATNALFIEYATMTPPWIPNYVVFNVYYPDYIDLGNAGTEMTAGEAGGGMYATVTAGVDNSKFIKVYNRDGTSRSVYDDINDAGVANSFYVNKLEHLAASNNCGSYTLPQGAWCLEIISRACISDANNPHYAGVRADGGDGTDKITADGFTSALALEKTTDGDLNGGTPT
ncbi:MAG: NHL repeat-containing protein, partial [bacterium]